MQLTQEQLKELAALPKFTKDTKIVDGMHIYTIINAKEDGALTHKGYNLIAHDVVLLPTDKDWQNWEDNPDNRNLSRYSLDQDDYWAVADANYLGERDVLSTAEIYESGSPIADNITVTYRY